MEIIKGIKMKTSLMLCLLVWTAHAYSQTLIYRTTIGVKVSTFEYHPVIEPIGDSNELKVITTDKSGLGNLEFTCNKDWNVKIWKFKNKDELLYYTNLINKEFKYPEITIKELNS